MTVERARALRHNDREVIFEDAARRTVGAALIQLLQCAVRYATSFVEVAYDAERSHEVSICVGESLNRYRAAAGTRGRAARDRMR